MSGPDTQRATIGRHRLVRKLGEGGMGVVWAAHDPQLDRSVAIKMIRPGAATAGTPDDTQARTRLMREARTAASVSHPNICPIYEVGEESGELYLVMELLEGEALSERIERGPMPLSEAMEVALGVLSALEALHRRGVVHRDLKPNNVFLTPHGVKLLDFGLARPVETEMMQTMDVKATMPGQLVGTPRYMAPEQWSGGEVTAAADIFAAGALLYEMLAGRPALLTVADVAKGSPAARSGLKRGDVVLAVNGYDLTDSEDRAACASKASCSVGSTVTYTVQRGATKKAIKVKLEKMPSNATQRFASKSASFDPALAAVVMPATVN